MRMLCKMPITFVFFFLIKIEEHKIQKQLLVELVVFSCVEEKNQEF
jgi:uncharacterized membrane protein